MRTMPRRLRVWLQTQYGDYLISGSYLLILLVISPTKVWSYYCVALLGLLAWLSAFWRARMIANVPVARIASAPQGYIQIKGEAAALEGTLPVFSPRHHLPCLWYRYHARPLRKVGSGQSVTQVSDTPFVINDGTGVCVVNPADAEIYTARKNSWESDGTRYTEWLILQGEPLYVLGEFRTRTGMDLQLDFRTDVGEILKAWKRDQEGLLKRFDLDGNGAIDAQEWALVCRAAEREVSRDHSEARREHGTFHTVSAPDDGRLFMISSFSPERFRKRLNTWAIVHLVITFSALASAVYIHRLSM